jgi:hypothetical protein
MEVPQNEGSLIYKLATTWHLNVPERRALPGGVARGNLVIAAIQQVVESEGWFPAHWRPHELFDGGLIELREDGSCRIYWKTEVSYSHYDLTSVQDFGSARDAAEAFAKKFFGESIDGIPLDWST